MKHAYTAKSRALNGKITQSDSQKGGEKKAFNKGVSHEMIEAANKVRGYSEFRKNKKK